MANIRSVLADGSFDSLRDDVAAHYQREPGVVR